MYRETGVRIYEPMIYFGYGSSGVEEERVF
jgi:hypothetical protein